MGLENTYYCSRFKLFWATFGVGVCALIVRQKKKLVYLRHCTYTHARTNRLNGWWGEKTYMTIRVIWCLNSLLIVYFCLNFFCFNWFVFSIYWYLIMLKILKMVAEWSCTLHSNFQEDCGIKDNRKDNLKNNKITVQWKNVWWMMEESKREGRNDGIKGKKGKQWRRKM